MECNIIFGDIYILNNYDLFVSIQIITILWVGIHNVTCYLIIQNNTLH